MLPSTERRVNSSFFRRVYIRSAVWIRDTCNRQTSHWYGSNLASPVRGNSPQTDDLLAEIGERRVLPGGDMPISGVLAVRLGSERADALAFPSSVLLL